MTFTEKYGDISLGYSEDKSRNDDWEQMGLCCPYEHCIETCGLDMFSDRCPMFGHNCPGGEDQVIECERTIKPWKKLYAKLTREEPELSVFEKMRLKAAGIGLRDVQVLIAEMKQIDRELMEVS